jgi:hypothetical protein
MEAPVKAVEMDARMVAHKRVMVVEQGDVVMVHEDRVVKVLQNVLLALLVLLVPLPLLAVQQLLNVELPTVLLFLADHLQICALKGQHHQ